MFPRSPKLIFAAILLLFLSITSSSAQPNPQQIDIVRDKWVVPHIYGKTDADVAYGFAWAICEDDFATIQKMLLTVKGRLAEVDGKGGAVLDFIAFISGAEDIVDTAYDASFSPGYKKIIEAYTKGVNDYAAANPQEILRPKLFPVSNKDVVAQNILTTVLLTGVYMDIQKIFLGDIKAYETNLPSGSNAFAISPSRTKDGKTYLAINSHQPLEGLFSWYEAHMVSEEGMNMLGATFPGGINLFLGTTPNLGWACTLNSPDLDDVYKLEMNPKHRLQYKLDGKWETLQVRKKTLHIKFGAIRIPYTKTFYWSKYGTTVKNKDGFYSVRFPANMDIRGGEALYQLGKTKNFTEWKNVMAQNAFPSVNFVYADRTDTTFYVSNGQFADRNPEYDWKKVLPGNTSATLWQKPFLPFSELPQVLNPKSGYLLNTNNSCFAATCAIDNPDIKKINPTYGFGTDSNNRSIMAHYLLSKQDKFSYEEFKKVKFNQDFNSSHYEYAISNIPLLFNLSAEKYPDLADAIAVLKSWNNSSSVDNKQAALITMAMYPIIDKITAHGRANEANSFTEKEYVDALRSAKKHLLKYFGTLTPALGDMQKHARGNIELPIGGMPDVLAATVSQPYKDGKRRTFVGESYIELVRYSKDTVEIETVNAFGASSRIGSPHSTDQMQMFVDQKLKPMTLNKEDIYKTAERIYHPGKQ